MRIRGRATAVLAACLLLAGCAAAPVDDPADVSLHLKQRLDVAFNPDTSGDYRPNDVAVLYALPDGWDFFMARCMNEAGFEDYSYDRFYGFTNGTKTASHSGSEGLAWYDCLKKYPIYNTEYAKFSDDQLDELYQYYDQFLVPCLGALGASVSEMPSRAAFADGGEGQPGWWNPFLAVPTPASNADVDLLFAKCAPYPDTVRL